jgi:glycine cleavage system T protein
MDPVGKRSPLYTWHAERGARIAPFASWDMPIQYAAGPLEEHRAVRRSVGLFDISHMGRFQVLGAGATAFLDSILSSSMASLAPGGARYALILAEDGGVLDDLFVYRLEDSWLLVVNAANAESDLARLRALAPAGILVNDISPGTAMIAVQGPRAIELLDALSGGALGPLPRNAWTRVELVELGCMACRTGYTGEDGAELIVQAALARELWDALMEEGARSGIEVLPIGLAARDSLRFEAGMPLYGHELSASIDPLSAGLSWACDFSKDFTGRAALDAIRAAGPERRLRTLRVEGGVPRQGTPILDASGRSVGEAVSGMFCPSLGIYACNAFLPVNLDAKGLGALIRSSVRPAEIVARPLYQPAYRRKQP